MNLKISRKIQFSIIGTALLAVMMIVVSWYELKESKSEILFTMHAEASTLIETMNRSTQSNLLANNEVERLIEEQLISVAALVSEFEKNRRPTSSELQSIADEHHVHDILITDREGSIAASNHATAGNFDITKESYWPDIKPLARTKAESRVLGLISAPTDGMDEYCVAYSRLLADGIVLVSLESKMLSDFRKRIGIGRLIQEIGDNSEIAYIALQDENGILSASKGLNELASIDHDEFLKQAIAIDSTLTRITQYQNRDVYEVVHSLSIESGVPALSRIALSMDKVHDVERRSRERVIITSIGIIILGAVVFGFLLTRQRYGLLKEEHRIIQTYTGSVLDNMADGVIAINPQGIITVFNKAAEKIFNRKVDEIAGKKYSDFLSEEFVWIQKTVDAKLPIEFREIEYHVHSGELRYLGISTSIIYSSANEVDTIVAVIQDLTERKHAQQQLERKEKLSAMGALASGIAHEIRNPLNAINIIVQRFQYEFEPTDGGEEYRHLAKTVRSEVQRVNQIVTQFLEFAKPPKLDRRKSNISLLCKETLDVVRSQAQVNRITIDTKIKDPIEIQIDSERMKQVLLNLYQNAIEAMPDGGVLSVSLEKEAKQVFIHISDTGTGIQPEIRDKIFNLYFTTKSSGTGFGLSLVQQIIQEHDGEIFLSSTSGQGTTFTIELPIDKIGTG